MQVTPVLALLATAVFATVSASATPTAIVSGSQTHDAQPETPDQTIPIGFVTSQPPSTLSNDNQPESPEQTIPIGFVTSQPLPTLINENQPPSPDQTIPIGLDPAGPQVKPTSGKSRRGLRGNFA